MLPRADAVTLLTSRNRDLAKRDAIQLAEALHRLPLALVQAAETLYLFPRTNTCNCWNNTPPKRSTTTVHPTIRAP